MREYRSLNVVLLFGSWGVVEMSVFYLLQDDVLCIYIPASRWKLQPPMTPQIDSKTLVADYPGGAESWNFRSPQWIFRRLGALCHSNLGELPSGYVKIAIENGTFIVHLPIKDRDFPGRYVSLPEGNPLPDLKRKPPSMELSIWGKAMSPREKKHTHVPRSTWRDGSTCCGSQAYSKWAPATLILWGVLEALDLQSSP